MNLPDTKNLVKEVKENGAIPFSRFMEIALYDSEEGYYASGYAVPGRDGDFFTSVSVGSCFGKILTRDVVEKWKTRGEPESFALIEQGADRGYLILDILSELQEFCPELLEKLSVVIIEPNEALRSEQKKTLMEHGCVTWIDELSELEDRGGGYFLANELLDALPIDLIKRKSDHWVSLWVALNEVGDGFVLEERGLEERSKKEIELALPDHNWPEGYTTELHTGLVDWVEDFFRSGFKGYATFFDYGFIQEDYRCLSRSEGTAKRIKDHQTFSDLLSDPGKSDVTAHVDWSRFESSMASGGAKRVSFDSQEVFITKLAASILKKMELSGQVDEEFVRQFQSLTHPSFLGRAFQAMQFEV